MKPNSQRIHSGKGVFDLDSSSTDNGRSLQVKKINCGEGPVGPPRHFLTKTTRFPYKPAGFSLPMTGSPSLPFHAVPMPR